MPETQVPCAGIDTVKSARASGVLPDMPPRTSRRRPLRLGLLVLAALVLVAAVPPPPASGAPLDEKRKEADALEADIEANAQQLDALNEQIKAAQDALDNANQTIADAQQRIEAAQAVTQQLEQLVLARAASVYRSASTGDSDPIFDADVGTLATREQYASAASQRDDVVLQQLSAAKADLAQRRREGEDAKQHAETDTARLEQTKAQFDAAQAQRQALLANVKGEIATLVAQAAAARRAAQVPRTFDPSHLPPVGGGAGSAVAFAQAQLGKPYCYGGAGPECFDCSGLTMASWGQAGVAMSHNSEAQYGSFPHVPMDQLAPGDIVWTPGHVGLYVGGGTAIHAPHTGDVVRYIGVSYFEGAARPG